MLSFISYFSSSSELTPIIFRNKLLLKFKWTNQGCKNQYFQALAKVSTSSPGSTYPTMQLKAISSYGSTFSTSSIEIVMVGWLPETW